MNFINLLAFLLFLLFFSLSQSTIFADSSKPKCLHSLKRFEHPQRKLTTTKIGDNNNNNNNGEVQKRNANILSSSSNTSSFISVGQYNNSIRFLIDHSNLVNISRYCTQVGQTRPTAYPGFGNKICTESDIFTEEKRRIYIEKLVPEVLKVIQGALVMTDEEKNHVNSGGNFIVNETACADSLLTIPTEHSTIGIAAGTVDFVVYLTCFPIDSWVFGWALSCATDATSKRITVAQINIPPHRLFWSSLESGELTYEDRTVVRITTHEFIHNLGLDFPVYVQHNLIKYVTDGRRGKSSVAYFNGTNSIAAVKKFYNCYDDNVIQGIELEDELDYGMPTHFESRVHHQDLMNSVAGRLQISNLTLSAITDLGNYYKLSPTYEQYLDPITFGNQFGCSLFMQPCNLSGGGKNDYYCWNESLTDECNFDFTASRATCSIQVQGTDLPYWGQYFPNEPKQGGPAYFGDDYCPMIQNTLQGFCKIDLSRRGLNLTDEEMVRGNVFTENSRCFKTTSDFRNLSSALTSVSSLSKTTCLMARCVRFGGINVERVEFSFFGTRWYSGCLFSNESEINQGGKQISNIDGFQGSVFCPPNATKFCYHNRILKGLDIVDDSFVVGVVEISTTTEFPNFSASSSAASCCCLISTSIFVILIMLSFLL